MRFEEEAEEGAEVNGIDDGVDVDDGIVAASASSAVAASEAATEFAALRRGRGRRHRGAAVAEGAPRRRGAERAPRIA